MIQGLAYLPSKRVSYVWNVSIFRKLYPLKRGLFLSPCAYPSVVGGREIPEEYKSDGYRRVVDNGDKKKKRDETPYPPHTLYIEFTSYTTVTYQI